jgi:tyrosine-protein kinase Etk/Wzc
MLAGEGPPVTNETADSTVEPASDATPGGDRQLIRLIPLPLCAVELVRLALRRWLVVLVFGLTGLAATFAFYCSATKWYEADIMIVPKRDTTSIGSLRALLGKLGVGIGPPHSEPERIASFLHSRSVTDGVIGTFDLVRRYEVGSIEVARKRLWSHCSTTVMKKPKVVHLTCEDEDPRIARDMSELFGQLADQGFRRVATSSAREERRFLDGRVAEAERDLDDSSRAIRSFQEANGVLDLPAQTRAAITGLGSLEGDIVSRRMELSYTRGFASNREASVLRLRRQIGVITGELHTLERRRVTRLTGSGPHSSASGVFPAVMDVPRLRAELEMLDREHDLREALFVFLDSQYEALKVKEARDVASFIVFDHAAVPTRHIRPTLRVLPPGFGAGLLLGVLFVSRQRWWRDLRAGSRRPLTWQPD